MTSLTLNVVMAQLNPTVGDIEGNIVKILDVINSHTDADLIVFGECMITGYPIEDLVNRPKFINTVMIQLLKLIEYVSIGKKPAIIVGTPYLHDNNIYNAAIFISSNSDPRIIFKSELPNYDVFDEIRNFHPGNLYDNTPIFYKGYYIGIAICEDMWENRVSENLYKTGVDILISINGSPYCIGKDSLRKTVINNRQSETHNSFPIMYVNQIGGQDGLIFDGASFVTNPSGDIVTQLPAFIEYIHTIKFIKQYSGVTILDPETCINYQYPDVYESMYRALMLSIRDYVNKNKFPGVLLGLSGGVDSALVMAIAVDALGSDKVWAIRMPSNHTSNESNDLALEMCNILGVICSTIPIADPVLCIENSINSLKVPFPNNDSKHLMEENIQSRERGQTLMALSNRYGHMVIATGNKTEFSIGYCTIYGDMCGGYALLKDVWKLDVFGLSEWRNKNHPFDSLLMNKLVNIIPERIITRPPSAELAEGQSDETSLMPYQYLDPLLIKMIETEDSVSNIINYLTATYGEIRDWQFDVLRIRNLVDRSEYKRRQSPPGPKITQKSFEKGRRYPITNAFKE